MICISKFFDWDNVRGTFSLSRFFCSRFLKTGWQEDATRNDVIVVSVLKICYCARYLFIFVNLFTANLNWATDWRNQQKTWLTRTLYCLSIRQLYDILSSITVQTYWTSGSKTALSGETWMTFFFEVCYMVVHLVLFRLFIHQKNDRWVAKKCYLKKYD